MSSTLPASRATFDLAAKVTGRDMTNPPPVKPKRRSALPDRLFGWAALAAALLTLALLFGILVSLVIGAWPAISQYGLGFLTSSVWDPVKNEYGGLVMIYGTLATSFIAL